MPVQLNEARLAQSVKALGLYRAVKRSGMKSCNWQCWRCGAEYHLLWCPFRAQSPCRQLTADLHAGGDVYFG